MNLTLIILGLIAAIAILVNYYRRSLKLSAQEEIYAELKRLAVVTTDFSTPEGALLCLEDAYRRRDLDAAIKAKDFLTEARLLLENTGFKDHINEQMIAKTAEALIAAYGAQMKQKWPDFNNIESFFTKREPYSNDIVIVTEVCRFPDGEFSTQRVLVAKTDEGWRVLNVVK